MPIRRLLPFVFSAACLCACDDAKDPVPMGGTPGQEAEAGLVLDSDTVTLREAGGGIVVRVRLQKKPVADVHVKLAFADSSEFSVSAMQAVIHPDDWAQGYTFTLTPLDDGIRDGDQLVHVSLSAQCSGDTDWNSVSATVGVRCIDDGTVGAPPPGPVDPPSCAGANPSGTKIRFMAANATSGNKQNYNDGKGIRMFQAMHPDIVLIQEFNYKNDSDANFREMIDTAFGTEFQYYRGEGTIPNGIISRYPITGSGSWNAKNVSDRDWEWAVVDIPGERDLLAVSVHLSTKDNAKEYGPLLQLIKAKQEEGDYYLVLGGDFNARSRATVRSSLGGTFAVHAKKDGDDDVCKSSLFPVDQNGNGCTSAERDDPYDWILFDKTLDTYEVPVVIGSRCYQYGHVLDSRAYDDHGEIDTIPPVLATDSWKYVDCPGRKVEDDCNGTTINNFQHMPVIRDIVLRDGK